MCPMHHEVLFNESRRKNLEKKSISRVIFLCEIPLQAEDFQCIIFVYISEWCIHYNKNFFDCHWKEVTSNAALFEIAYVTLKFLDTNILQVIRHLGWISQIIFTFLAWSFAIIYNSCL